MKKLLAALMVLGSTAAFAQIDASELGTKAREETHEAGQGAKQQAQDVGKKLGMATEDQGTFRSAQAFNLKGTLKDSGREEVTVERKNLPPATLDIRDKTAVYINGKKAKPSDLQKGMDVKAKFQLEGNEVVAVRLDAKTSAYGGAGSQGTMEKSQKKSSDQNQGATDQSQQQSDKLNDTGNTQNQ